MTCDLHRFGIEETGAIDNEEMTDIHKKARIRWAIHSDDEPSTIAGNSAGLLHLE